LEGKVKAYPSSDHWDYPSSNYTELMPLPWKPVQRLVNTDIVLAFDQFLGITEALHTDLDTAIMIAGTDWDESTSRVRGTSSDKTDYSPGPDLAPNGTISGIICKEI
ncbi:hypothetical protein FOC4_g10002515, partial [Fusarium odoratissimum]